MFPLLAVCGSIAAGVVGTPSAPEYTWKISPENGLARVEGAAAGGFKIGGTAAVYVSVGPSGVLTLTGSDEKPAWVQAVIETRKKLVGPTSYTGRVITVSLMDSRVVIDGKDAGFLHKSPVHNR